MLMLMLMLCVHWTSWTAAAAAAAAAAAGGAGGAMHIDMPIYIHTHPRATTVIVVVKEGFYDCHLFLLSL